MPPILLDPTADVPLNCQLLRSQGKTMLLKLFIVFLVCLMASTIQSCAHVNVAKASVAQVDMKRMTYKALRQHDCRVNEPNEFCARGFSNEYVQYERLRQQYLTDKDDSGLPFQQTSLSKHISEIW